MQHLKKKSKQLSRKQHSRKKGDNTKKSNRYKKQQKTIAKIHEKISNQRKDFLHKLSSKIISENQVIGIEDLAVSNMMKNKKLARHIAQSGWRMFREFLTYKADWYERDLVVHDRFFASSKLNTYKYQWSAGTLSIWSMLYREKNNFLRYHPVKPETFDFSRVVLHYLILTPFLYIVLLSSLPFSE